MSIYYAGRALLLPDDQGELQAWLDRYYPLEDLRLFGATTQEQAANRRHCQHDEYAGVGIPRPNYPAPPRLKLNTLYNPTGASRRATFIGLSEDGGYFAGLSAFNDTIEYHLELYDGTTRISLPMVCLPPRPISVPRRKPNAGQNEAAPETLWLIPLVDERHFWQHKPLLLDLDPSPGDYITARWLYDRIVDSLCLTSSEIDFGDSIFPFGENDKSFPLDTRTIWRRFESTAAVFDGMLWSGGGARLVHRPSFNNDSDIKFKVTNFETSQAFLDGSNVSNDDQSLSSFLTTHVPGLVAGGQIMPNHVPSSVRVAFRELWYGIIRRWESRYGLAPTVFYEETVELSDVSGYVPGLLQYATTSLKKIFFTTMFAQLPDEVGTSLSTAQVSNPNTGSTSSLAQQLAIHFYKSLMRQYDFTFAGLRTWHPTAYDDYVEYSLGDRRGGDYTALTRVVSMPPDVGVGENISQDFTGEPSHVLMEFPKVVYGISEGVPAYNSSDPVASLGSVLIWPGQHENMSFSEGFDYIRPVNFSGSAIASGPSMHVVCAQIGNRWVVVWDNYLECYDNMGTPNIRLRQAARTCP